ncbi:MAG: MerR family transcriptional regulator [bacterium]|nr:MerR family transcriptional regulator [bacterium]
MDTAETKPIFTLSVAAEILGVHPRTLMIYENEGLAIPARTKTNRRRYSQKDLRSLQFIRFLTNKKGVNLAGVKAILQMIKLGSEKGLDLQKKIFPDFVESKTLF